MCKQRGSTKCFLRMYNHEYASSWVRSCRAALCTKPQQSTSKANDHIHAYNTTIRGLDDNPKTLWQRRTKARSRLLWPPSRILSKKILHLQNLPRASRSKPNLGQRNLSQRNLRRRSPSNQMFKSPNHSSPNAQNPSRHRQSFSNPSLRRNLHLNK